MATTDLKLGFRSHPAKSHSLGSTSGGCWYTLHVSSLRLGIPVLIFSTIFISSCNDFSVSGSPGGAGRRCPVIKLISSCGISSHYCESGQIPHSCKAAKMAINLPVVMSRIPVASCNTRLAPRTETAETKVDVATSSHQLPQIRFY